MADPLDAAALACTDCGAPLTAEERYWYAGRCEACEIAWCARVELWRRGGDDPELSELFGGSEQEGHA